MYGKHDTGQSGSFPLHVEDSKDLVQDVILCKQDKWELLKNSSHDHSGSVCVYPLVRVKVNVGSSLRGFTSLDSKTRYKREVVVGAEGRNSETESVCSGTRYIAFSLRNFLREGFCCPKKSHTNLSILCWAVQRISAKSMERKLTGFISQHL